MLISLQWSGNWRLHNPLYFTHVKTELINMQSKSHPQAASDPDIRLLKMIPRSGDLQGNEQWAWHKLLKLKYSLKTNSWRSTVRSKIHDEHKNEWQQHMENFSIHCKIRHLYDVESLRWVPKEKAIPIWRCLLVLKYHNSNSSISIIL